MTAPARSIPSLLPSMRYWSARRLLSSGPRRPARLGPEKGPAGLQFRLGQTLGEMARRGVANTGPAGRAASDRCTQCLEWIGRVAACAVARPGCFPQHPCASPPLDRLLRAKKVAAYHERGSLGGSPLLRTTTLSARSAVQLPIHT